MTTLDYSTINLGLPAVPETNDPKLFQELVRVYNAIKILAQGIDVYTVDGTVTTSVSTIADQLEGLVDSSAQVSELRKQYYKYTVPKFTVKGAFGCNGKTAQTAVALSGNTSLALGSAAGNTAGAFDTAATRDAAINAINSNKNVLDQIVAALQANGILL